MDRQLANTKHAARGGKFDQFTGRRLSLPRRDDRDESGLCKLEYPKKNKRKGA